MNVSNVGIIVAIVLYLLTMIIIGLTKSKNNTSSEEFYIGGRRLGPLMVAMSVEASDMSSWLLMGLPGLAFLSGCCDPFWTAFSLWIGGCLNWLIVSKPLRRYSKKLDAITIPDFFARRFNDKKNIIGAVAALVIIVFFIPYTASGFAACGKLFNTIFGVDYTTAMIVSAVVIIIYTLLGGFSAVCLTDMIQSIVMTIALIAVVLFCVSGVGGINSAVDNLNELPGYLSFNSTYDSATNSASHYGLLTVISNAAWGLGLFGMPHILIRFMSIREEKELTISRRVALSWALITMFVAACIGMMGFEMTRMDKLPKISDSETVIIEIARKISEHGVLSALLAGIVLAGILAATMSTADSQMLSAASSFSQDLLQNTFKIKMSEKMSVVAARIAIICIGIIAVFFAGDPNSSIFTIVSFAWAGFGASFGPVMLCSLFWKRYNLSGALAGMISGGVMVFVWKFAISPIGGIFNIYELLPAFIVSCVCTIIVSLITKKPEDEIVKEFEEVRS